MSYPADCRWHPGGCKQWRFARVVAVLDDTHVTLFDIVEGVWVTVPTAWVQRRTISPMGRNRWKQWEIT